MNCMIGHGFAKTSPRRVFGRLGQFHRRRRAASPVATRAQPQHPESRRRIGAKTVRTHCNGRRHHGAGSAGGRKGRTALGQAEGVKAQAVWQPSQGVEVQVHILPVERLVSRLLSDDLDFFVADGRAARDHPSIAVEPIGTAPIGYHVRPGHELLDRKRLSVADIAAYPRASPNLPMVPLDAGPAVRQSSRPEAGSVYCEQVSTLVELTARSDAVLLAISAAIAEHIDAGRLLTLAIPEIADWSAQIVIARRARLYPTPTAERYAVAMATHVRNRWIETAQPTC